MSLEEKNIDNLAKKQISNKTIRDSYSKPITLRDSYSKPINVVIIFEEEI